MKHAKPPRARSTQELTRLLNLSDEDAVEIDLRVDLNDKIIEVVKRRRLTHAAVAELAHTSRTKITALLNQHLAASLDLQLQAKPAHWNVKGENFIALHELFDGVATRVSEAVDVLAERITALGGVAEGTVQAVAKVSPLAAYPLTASTSKQHLEALSAALAQVGAGARQAIATATDLNDANTADLFTEISRQLDKDLWFLEAHLGG
jgi:starvation-inducible DNA-binding protein